MGARLGIRIHRWPDGSISSKKWPWLIRIVIVRPRLFSRSLAGLVAIAVVVAFDYWAAGSQTEAWPLGVDPTC